MPVLPAEPTLPVAEVIPDEPTVENTDDVPGSCDVPTTHVADPTRGTTPVRRSGRQSGVPAWQADYQMQ